MRITPETIAGVIFGLVMLLVLFNVAAEIVPDVADAGDTLNATGLPLASVFASDGIVPLIIMASILIAVVAFVFTMYKKRR